MFTPIIKRLETDDEHYYFIGEEYYPAVTKILSWGMYTPVQLMDWRGRVGNEVAEEIMNSAGDRGSMIHDLLENLINGADIDLTKMASRDAHLAYNGFGGWLAEYQPKFLKLKDFNLATYGKSKLGTEFTVASEEYKFAGTVDLLCEIDGEVWIVDFKTSKGVYDSHMLQITAYQQAFEEMTGIKPRRGILHLKNTTKKGYQFVEKIEIAKREVEMEDYMHVYELAKIRFGGKLPEPPKVQQYPELFNLESLWRKEPKEQSETP